ncbi:MAG TPA: hypothetical protein VFA34_01610 [Actinomycetota bacterium]|nr:hypothetical protein [Actinomycetota bacterium]
MALGTVAGALGLGCCVGPAVAALIGVSSASAAADLGNRLYADWGWVFKTGAVAFAGAALLLQRRRAQDCPIDERPSLRRVALWTLGTGLATYGALYAGTKALERFA